MRPILIEPLKIEKLNIAIADLPKSLIGTKIIQLSDLHYDRVHLPEALFQEAIVACNREQPDLIVITGDLVTDSSQTISDLAVRLQQLNSKFGIYGCLGNHDSSVECVPERLITDLAKVGIKILVNEVVYPLGSGLALAGLADYWSRDFNSPRVFSQIEPNIPRIVLSHNPDSAQLLSKYRLDLQLSGHTHGGQIVIPGYGPAPMLLQQIRKNTPSSIASYIPFLKKCAPVVKNWQWSEGWHQIGKNQLYINRGLGTYFPGRLNCPPEVTVITLEQ